MKIFHSVDLLFLRAPTLFPISCICHNFPPHIGNLANILSQILQIFLSQILHSAFVSEGGRILHMQCFVREASSKNNATDLLWKRSSCRKILDIFLISYFTEIIQWKAPKRESKGAPSLTLTDMFTNKVELLSKAGGLSPLGIEANASCSGCKVLENTLHLHQFLGNLHPEN